MTLGVVSRAFRTQPAAERSVRVAVSANLGTTQSYVCLCISITFYSYAHYCSPWSSPKHVNVLSPGMMRHIYRQAKHTPYSPLPFMKERAARYMRQVFPRRRRRNPSKPAKVQSRLRRPIPKTIRTGRSMDRPRLRKRVTMSRVRRLRVLACRMEGGEPSWWSLAVSSTLQLLLVCRLGGVCWTDSAGYLNAFGMFQALYENEWSYVGTADVALIGSLQVSECLE